MTVQRDSRARTRGHVVQGPGRPHRQRRDCPVARQGRPWRWSGALTASGSDRI